MITVCEKHIKEAITLLNVPHIQKLSQKYWEHRCFFCNQLAHFKLIDGIPARKPIKVKTESNVS